MLRSNKVWPELKYWSTGEYQVIEERLDDARREGRILCPRHDLIFAPLRSVSLDEIRVLVVAQDPYPDPFLCTGHAFSVPTEVKSLPLTLKNIFKEYEDDLHYKKPITGDLTPWIRQGVMLWNAIPTCEAYKSLSHINWIEWKLLTQEVVEKTNEIGIVCAFLGSVAREFAKYVNTDKSEVICTSHPSPRGIMSSKSPFIGSRLFTQINAKLVECGHATIDWRLPHE